MLGIIVFLNKILFNLSIPNGYYIVKITTLSGNEKLKSFFKIFIKMQEEEKKTHWNFKKL